MNRLLCCLGNASYNTVLCIRNDVPHSKGANRPLFPPKEASTTSHEKSIAKYEVQVTTEEKADRWRRYNNTSRVLRLLIYIPGMYYTRHIIRSSTSTDYRLFHASIGDHSLFDNSTSRLLLQLFYTCIRKFGTGRTMIEKYDSNIKINSRRIS